MSDPIQIHGLPHLLKKLDRPDWIAGPLGNLLDRWRFTVQRKTVANFGRGRGGWIDTGATRQSITSERDTAYLPQWGRVGSNKDTARWGEYGTGLLSEDPASSHRQYFPPLAAFERWAPKHGMTPYQVALSIFRKGGTEPRSFLRDAAKDAQGQFPHWIDTLAHEIEREASYGA